ncbi:MAG: acetate--CoA ligase family protein [Syntrophobacteraceae bacterium]
MDSLFCAQSVAVVGVSEARENLGRLILSNLVRFGYQGQIYAIGPRGEEVHGHRIYRSVSELPRSPDVVVILTPARFIPELLVECGEKGVRWVIIESGGFGETGAEGRLLEKGALDVCRRYGMRIVGPNCVGVLNTAIGLYTSFLPMRNAYKRGCVGVCSQSGGIGAAIAGRLSFSGVGVSKLVSMGNKLDLDEVDFLAYFLADPDTTIIFFLLEDFRRGLDFANLARQSGKPIVLFKSNTSSASHGFAQSHTAALAMDDQVVDAVCHESGIIRVYSISEGINVVKGLSLPRLKGNNLAIMSRSGGHAVVAADVSAKYGFTLPALGADIISEAESRARAGVVRLGNPLDLGDNYDLPFFFTVVEMALCQDNIHGVVFTQIAQMVSKLEEARDFLEKMVGVGVKLGKPVAVVMEIPYEARVFLEKTSGVPFFLEPTDAVQALAAQRNWSMRIEEPASVITGSESAIIPVANIEKWFDDIVSEKRQPLLHEVFDLLDRTGIPTVSWHMTRGVDEAVEAAEHLGFPVALKAVAPSLVHKSDKGGVVLDLRDYLSLSQEWDRLHAISDDIEGILVQKMAPAFRELIIGGKRDPSFGPVVLVGFGGIMVEVMKDVQMRLAPIGSDTALSMLQGLKGASMLGPFRGMQQADLEAVARILVQVSLLMHQFPRIGEMDLNPVSLDDGGKGAVAIDARVLLTLD